ncbi:MAG: hypothetical protein SFU27_04745 [Thermonemataceae bacterium]|nr:hypothetical protein [Thermonemataceae bacterium]
MRKINFLMVLFALLSMANQCKKSADLSAIIDKTWLRSQEEEKGDGVEVYRPETYNFPLSRGARTGFKLSKSGEFTEIIAPADAPMYLKGTWKESGKNRISISLEKNTYTDKTNKSYELLEYNEKIVRIKP